MSRAWTVGVGGILLAVLLFIGPAAFGVTFHRYEVKTTAAGTSPTEIEFAVKYQCSDATSFGVHLWLYSFDTGETLWDEKIKGRVASNRPKTGYWYEDRNLAPGQYLVASSNALCWQGRQQSQGVGPRGLRCWDTFEVTRTRVIRGQSFDGADCTDI